ncbi:MAG: cation:proton antiporter [Bernardetiaceae bacterium]
MILAASIDIPILTDLLVIFLISIVLILILSRLKLPSVVGFLLTGVICGNNGLDFHLLFTPFPADIQAFLMDNFPKHISPPEESVESLAEIGVMMLLFTIGLEFSVANLMRIKRAVFLGGSLQVILTAVLFGTIAYFTTYDFLPIAVFFGMIFALSSTAIVLKLLSERGEINKPHGQVILAILIFQDIAVVPMMLLIPILSSGDPSALPWELMLMTIKVVGIIGLMIVLGRYVMPVLLYQIAKAQSDDLFVISILVLCFAIAYVTGLVGLSFALGAFLAGLVVSETRYGHHAIGTIISFKELFTSVFFISVGLMMDLDFVLENFATILFFAFLIMFFKAFIGGIVVLVLGGKLRTLIAVAFGISQIGEFSFILAKIGEDYGLMPIELYQYFLSIAVMTMIITPVLMNLSDKVSYLLLHSPLIPKAIRYRLSGIPMVHSSHNLSGHQLSDHLIIIGLNITGRTVAHGARELNIPYVVIEKNPEVVDEQVKQGTPIIYGDATNEEVLKHAKIEKAAVIVMSLQDANSAIPIIEQIHQMQPKAHIIVRTPSIKDMVKLKRHGANAVVADEIESNMGVLIQVLEELDVSVNEAYRFSSYIQRLAGIDDESDNELKYEASSH